LKTAWSLFLTRLIDEGVIQDKDASQEIGERMRKTKDFIRAGHTDQNIGSLQNQEEIQQQWMAFMKEQITKEAFYQWIQENIEEKIRQRLLFLCQDLKRQ
jgi:hypothetical protein